MSTVGGPDWADAGDLTLDRVATPPTAQPFTGGSFPSPYNSVWWRFTAHADGLFVVDTYDSTGTDAATAVKLYEGGTDEASATEVGFNDSGREGVPDALANLAYLEVAVTAGSTYHLKVGSAHFSDNLPDEYVVKAGIYTNADAEWLDQDPLTGSASVDHDSPWVGASNILDFEINPELTIRYNVTFATWSAATDNLGTYTVQEGWDTFRGASTIAPGRTQPALGGGPGANQFTLLVDSTDLNWDTDPGTYIIWHGQVMVVAVEAHAINIVVDPEIVFEFENPNGHAAVELGVAATWDAGDDSDFFADPPLNTRPEAHRDAGPVRLLLNPGVDGSPTFPDAESGQPDSPAVTVSGTSTHVNGEQRFGAGVVPVPDMLFNASVPEYDKHDVLFRSLNLGYSANVAVARSRYRLLSLIPPGGVAPPCQLYPRDDHYGAGSGAIWPPASSQQAGHPGRYY